MRREVRLYWMSIAVAGSGVGLAVWGSRDPPHVRDSAIFVGVFLAIGGLAWNHLHATRLRWHAMWSLLILGPLLGIVPPPRRDVHVQPSSTRQEAEPQQPTTADEDRGQPRQRI